MIAQTHDLLLTNLMSGAIRAKKDRQEMEGV